LAALVVFVAGAVFAVVSWPPLRHLDTVAAASGHGLLGHARALRQATLIVTDLGSPLAVDVVTVVAAGVLLLAHRRRPAVAVAVARLGELATETATKAVVNRPRPDLLPHLTSAGGTSFPSGHAAGSAAAYGAIAVILAASCSQQGRVAVLAATAAFVLAVGTSRVLLGVHFPTDVVGGLALGVVWIAVAQAVARSGGTPHTALRVSA
jgi:undecaprenyl-diphosphatase